MTAIARLVLADCEDALQDLNEIDVGPMWQRDVGPVWRRRWVAVMALLRAVGDTLNKVDGRTDGTLHQLLKRERKRLEASKPEPQIYWNFICKERNLVLHEYKMRAHLEASGDGVSELRLTLSGNVITAKPNKYEQVHIHLLSDGPFAGRREVDVVAEAIQWWQSYLDRVDAQR